MSKNIFMKIIPRITAEIRSFFENTKYHEVASKYDLQGYKRIYLVHIRKTGGTSLNNMFLSLSGVDSTSLYRQLAENPVHRLIVNGLIFVGWNVRYINKGSYYYAFSHTPLHKLNLPENTFTVTCFRDPVKRVVSHYNMLMDYQENNISHPCMLIEGKWLGESFDDFILNLPKDHLLNQLFMFSDLYNVDEAVENVQQLSHYFFSDTFESGVHDLNRKTGLNLKSIHIRKSSYHVQVSDDSLSRLRRMLDKEYIFLEHLKDVQVP